MIILRTGLDNNVEIAAGLHNNVEHSYERSDLCSRQARKAVKGALEDIGGRHLVDDLSPTGARNVVGDERSGDHSGRKPLVPKDDWQIGSGR